jgi:hypothetical protein
VDRLDRLDRVADWTDWNGRLVMKAVNIGE